ncbi:hypothetical protein ACHAWF_005163 [Thalassiosira exigua]
MNAEKKIKKEMKSHHKSQPSSERYPPMKEIEPPKIHRDMRLICDVFRISEQTRYALRSFDSATLEDFSLMTDQDFADLVVTQARKGHPLPPLQQRKLRVLLGWVQSLGSVENLDKAEATMLDSPNKTEGFELKDSKRENGDILKASFKSSPRREGGSFIPRDWETRFYADLPNLKKKLQSGSQESNWVLEFLSLRWAFCGFDK